MVDKNYIKAITHAKKVMQSITEQYKSQLIEPPHIAPTDCQTVFNTRLINLLPYFINSNQTAALQLDDGGYQSGPYGRFSDLCSDLLIGKATYAFYDNWCGRDAVTDKNQLHLSYFMAFDIDNHNGDRDSETVFKCLLSRIIKSKTRNILAMQSSEGSYHIFVLWKTPKTYYEIKQFINKIVSYDEQRSGLFEVFPNKNVTEVKGKKGAGKAIRALGKHQIKDFWPYVLYAKGLPLQYAHPTEDITNFKPIYDCKLTPDTINFVSRKIRLPGNKQNSKLITSGAVSKMDKKSSGKFIKLISQSFKIDKERSRYNTLVKLVTCIKTYENKGVKFGSDQIQQIHDLWFAENERFISTDLQSSHIDFINIYKNFGHHITEVYNYTPGFIKFVSRIENHVRRSSTKTGKGEDKQSTLQKIDGLQALAYIIYQMATNLFKRNGGTTPLYLGTKMLSNFTGKTPKWVHTSLKELEEIGLIEKLATGNLQNMEANTYCIAAECYEAFDEVKVSGEIHNEEGLIKHILNYLVSACKRFKSRVQVFLPLAPPAPA